MVQLMMAGESRSRTAKKKAAVKMEAEDSLQQDHSPLKKRPRQSIEPDSFTVSPSVYNPVNEPSPLGLRLRKSPSLLELIQIKLSQGSAASAKSGTQSDVKKEAKTPVSSGDKLKASNFPGSVLRIGNWEYKSRYEGDLVAKCYFAKHKLVWEVLDGGLKNKIEIQWSDIMALKANYPDDGPGTLDVVLARQPLFFRETNPQPRKHTLWQATSDFTGGEASINRRHYLQCCQGLLGKHFEKLIQCDPRLDYLSRREGVKLDSPYFEPKIQAAFDDRSGNADLNREESPSFSLQDSAAGESPSPISGRHDDVKSMVPGLRSSASMTDLVNHLDHRILHCNQDWDGLDGLEFRNVPDDSQVNSLRCSLLQKESKNPWPESPSNNNTICNDGGSSESNPMIARNDSVGDLLLNLPRIASLPQFLFNVAEDC